MGYEPGVTLLGMTATNSSSPTGVSFIPSMETMGVMVAVVVSSVL